MIDIGRDDGAACGDLGADELGGDFVGNPLRETIEDAGSVGGLGLGGADVLFVQAVAQDVVREIGDLGAAHVFADGDELHLRGDDALACVVELGDGGAFAGLERLALGVDGGLERAEEAFALGGGVFGVVFGEVAVVAGLDGAAFIGGDVATGFDPGFAEGREAGFDGAFVVGIAPGAGGVIDTNGGVFFDLAVEGLRGAELDFAHGDADVGVDLALDVNAGRGGELLAGVRFEGVFGGDHEEEFAEQTLAMDGLVCGCWQWIRKNGRSSEGTWASLPSTEIPPSDSLRRHDPQSGSEGFPRWRDLSPCNGTPLS